jgi:hypothetical protein
MSGAFQRGDRVVVSGTILATFVKYGNPGEAVISLGAQTQVVSVLTLQPGVQREEVDYS